MSCREEQCAGAEGRCCGGIQVKRESEDCGAVIGTENPEVSSGTFASGVRFGLGARLQWLPALCKVKKKWRLPQQSNPTDYLDEAESGQLQPLRIRLLKSSITI